MKRQADHLFQTPAVGLLPRRLVRHSFGGGGSSSEGGSLGEGGFPPQNFKEQARERHPNTL
jgi:hypothetical protein